MRRLILVAVMVGAAQGAVAADMPDFPALRGFVSDTPRTTRTNWEGIYVGGQGGYSAANMKFTGVNDSVVSDFMLKYGSQFVSPLNLPTWPALGRTYGDAITYGGFAGYNWQWDDAILGVELNYNHAADLGAMFVGVPRYSSITTSGGSDYQGITNSQASLTVHDFGTVRLRAGYSAGAFMPYAFVGLALGRVDYYRSVTGTVMQGPTGTTPLTTVALTQTETKTALNQIAYGYSFGAGSEVMLVGGLFARGEYEYVRFTSPIDINMNTFRGGIGYKF